MNEFWKGFIKQAGIVRSIGRTLGNITGARQLKAGLGQALHEVNRGATVQGGEFIARPGINKRLIAANKNIAQGGAKALGTAAVGTAGIYGANKLLSSPQQPQQQ